MRLNVRPMLVLCITTLLSVGATPGVSSAAEPQTGRGRPFNIVFILMDDLGWSDLGCYGNTFNETPNIDRLAAMLASADEGVGRIMAALREMGLDEQTLVVFTSDNGGELRVTTNAPLRAGKSTLYEGGIRVPLIACGAGVDRKGEVCDVPVTTVDFYPTFLNIAGARPKPGQILDGESLLPLLKTATSLRRDAIYWHFPLDEPLKRRPGSAVRQGGFKLIEFLDRPERHLDDLEQDIGETHDLAQEMPEKAAELAASLQAALSLAFEGTRRPSR